jgi:hypothetical protein
VKRNGRVGRKAALAGGQKVLMPLREIGDFGGHVPVDLPPGHSIGMSSRQDMDEILRILSELSLPPGSGLNAEDFGYFVLTLSHPPDTWPARPSPGSSPTSSSMTTSNGSTTTAGSAPWSPSSKPSPWPSPTPARRRKRQPLSARDSDTRQTTA